MQEYLEKQGCSVFISQDPTTELINENTSRYRVSYTCNSISQKDNEGFDIVKEFKGSYNYEYYLNGLNQYVIDPLSIHSSNAAFDCIARGDYNSPDFSHSFENLQAIANAQENFKERMKPFETFLNNTSDDNSDNFLHPLVENFVTHGDTIFRATSECFHDKTIPVNTLVTSLNAAGNAAENPDKENLAALKQLQSRI